MNNGIYHVQFRSPQGTWGEGLAVFQDQKIHGGDHGYLYKGRYESTGDKVKAQISVQRWNASVTSVFGNVPEFELSLAGFLKPGSDTFEVTGDVAGRQGLKITISGKKISDLVS